MMHSACRKTHASRVATYETNYGDGTARVRLGKEKQTERRKREKNRGRLMHGRMDGWWVLWFWLIDCMMELIDEFGRVSWSFCPVSGVSLHGTGTRDKIKKGKLLYLAIDFLTWTLNDYGMLMFFFFLMISLALPCLVLF